MTLFYGEGLARTHDKNFGNLATSAAEHIMALGKPNDKDHPLVVDLGSGSGILAARLTAKGYHVRGVDRSAAMVALARTNAPLAEFSEGSLFDFDIPPCDIVCSIGECICYLSDDKTEDYRIKDLFQKVYDRLPDNGRFVFDILTPEVPAETRSRFLEADAWSMYLNITVDQNAQILTRDITLFSKDGDCYRRSHEVHRQRLYDREEVAVLLRAIGFEVSISGHYHQEQLRQGHVAFICKK